MGIKAFLAELKMHSGLGGRLLIFSGARGFWGPRERGSDAQGRIQRTCTEDGKGALTDARPACGTNLRHCSAHSNNALVEERGREPSMENKEVEGGFGGEECA